MTADARLVQSELLNVKPAKPAYPFRIEVRPMLTCGGFGFGPDSLFIFLAEGSTKAEANQTLWHEVVHMLKYVSGQTEHDEAEVDAIAAKLAAACPEGLELCGLSDKFK